MESVASGKAKGKTTVKLTKAQGKKAKVGTDRRGKSFNKSEHLVAHRLTLELSGCAHNATALQAVG